MTNKNVFVSVGGTATEAQERFVRGVEERLRSEGLIPHTVGRNTFGSDAPLKTITDLMDDCAGTVVIALERMYFPSGLDKRGGPQETTLSDVRLPTAWNQVEAAMSYAHGLPLLVIIEAGLKSEGLLERGYDWYVQWLAPEAGALSSPEFNGVLASWKKKVIERKSPVKRAADASEMTVAEILGGLKPAQLWRLVGALAALVAGAFALGGGLFGAR